MFARQLVALRRLGVVHGETRDGRGMGLFLLNSVKCRDQGALLAEMCKFAGGAGSMWCLKQEKVVPAAKQLGLRSVVQQDKQGKKRLSLLVGPLSLLNHSLLSGVVFTDGTPSRRLPTATVTNGKMRLPRGEHGSRATLRSLMNWRGTTPPPPPPPLSSPSTMTTATATTARARSVRGTRAHQAARPAAVAHEHASRRTSKQIKQQFIMFFNFSNSSR